MSSAQHLLQSANAVLVIDWPSKDVPETLARAGLAVVVKGGPLDTDYSTWRWNGSSIRREALGHPPDHSDIVYCHRPLDELPSIVILAQKVGAGAIWSQSGRNETGANDAAGCWVPDDESQARRTIVEAAQLTYIDSPYIADVARQLIVSS
jgi:hypothetical protein